MLACGSLRRALRGPDDKFGKMVRAGLGRPALQILITAHLVSDLKVRPPKEKSRFLTPPKCGRFGMTARNGAIPGIRMFRFWRMERFWGGGLRRIRIGCRRGEWFGEVSAVL